MGTDIHGVFQRRNESGGWATVTSKFEFNRHYQLFAVLADVRNGSGFAGVVTGERVEPIAAPRGLPADFHGQPGDHSFSWLTSEEMLAWHAAAPTVVKTGIISAAAYETWDGTGPPEVYCGGVSGPGVIIRPLAGIGKPDPNVIDAAMAVAPSAGAPTHVRIAWRSPLKTELAYFFDEVARLHAKYCCVRFVFGFDS